LDRLSDYDYELPESLIAQRPLDDRAASRLLWVHRDTGQIDHGHFRDVTQILRAGDLLVVNNTRVTARRIFGKKPTGGEVELLLLHGLGGFRFECLARPGRRVPVGATVEFGAGWPIATIVSVSEGPTRTVEFSSDPTELLRATGAVPLPPYIQHQLEDEERYQTVFAQTGGSAAAPTAGLHFTDELVLDLRSRGIDFAEVTLNVGIDTFRPVQVEQLDLHEMHGETCTLPTETAEKIHNCQGRIIAVGTTSVRTLESFAVGPRRVETGTRSTALFIRPGYRFQVIDGMFTNFHMPRTTMLMMISALAGHDHVFRAYGEAVEQRYRFLSFGDSMLIL
jgi:S-adenosylmethionine:tRNA ribosyltransferase-isomerase